LSESINTNIASCTRCGKCCEKGGPALHGQDLQLIREKKIPLSSLITIRKGELVHNPQTGTVQAAAVELVKLSGRGQQWSCLYYRPAKGCTIYDHRPQACRILKCWDTAEILSVVEKDTLDRFQILAENDPLVPLIREHEQICPCHDLQAIYLRRKTLSSDKKTEIEQRVRQDLRFRSQVIVDLNLQLSEELFYFGRPFFQLLQPMGIGDFKFS
jgi:Fe-S-cluster containining protein